MVIMSSSTVEPAPTIGQPVSMDIAANGCLPFRVILDRLPKETYEFYYNRDNPPEKDDDDDDDDDGEEEDHDEDDFIEKEPQIFTLDLQNVDLSKMNSNGAVKSYRMKMDGKLFCLFNLEEFDDQYEAITAFYRELRYAPFRCVECDEATVELKGLVDHYLVHHPTIKKAQYWIEESKPKEKWVHKFISYQIECNNEEDEMFPNEIVNKFCPVCNHYDYLTRSSEPKPKLKVSPILDMNHINKHLRYNPWECILCRKNGRRYAISSVNKKAQDHLENKHNIHSASKHGKDYFKSTATIPELENFLKEYINIIKGSDRQMALPVVRRKPLAGKSNRQNANKGKSTGQLYKQASASYKRIKESRESVRIVKKANNRKIKGDFKEEEEDFECSPIITDDKSKFFCIFCLDDNHNLSDIYSAWGHYATHLKYTPIICGICNKTFTSDTSFRYHGIEHVEHSDLPFTRNCDEAIETWGHEFLEGLVNDSEAKPEFASFCPVCEKILPKPVEIPHLHVNSVKSHVYSHLKYHPYECIPCSSQLEKKTFVGDLDYQAALHLNSVHSITVTPSEIPNYFVKSRGIESLDELLRKHFTGINYLIGAPTELTSSTSSSSSSTPTSTTSLTQPPPPSIC